jgi:hypothetical protein
LQPALQEEALLLYFIHLSPKVYGKERYTAFIVMLSWKLYC